MLATFSFLTMEAHLSLGPWVADSYKTSSGKQDKADSLPSVWWKYFILDSLNFISVGVRKIYSDVVFCLPYFVTCQAFNLCV